MQKGLRGDTGKKGLSLALAPSLHGSQALGPGPGNFSGVSSLIPLLVSFSSQMLGLLYACGLVFYVPCLCCDCGGVFISKSQSSDLGPLAAFTSQAPTTCSTPTRKQSPRGPTAALHYWTQHFTSNKKQQIRNNLHPQR